MVLRIATKIASGLLQALTVMLMVAMIAFMISRFIGDPVANMVGPETSLEDRRLLRSELGLDDPLPVQFGRFVAGAVQGRFGISYRFQRPAAELIAERLPATLELVAVALLFALALGSPLGAFGAVRRDAAARRAQIEAPDKVLRRLSTVARAAAAAAVLLAAAALFSDAWWLWLGAVLCIGAIALCAAGAGRRLTVVSGHAFIGASLGDLAFGVATAITLLGVSLPAFVIGIVLIYVFSVNLQLLPAFGRGDIVEIGGWDSSLFAASGWRSILMPAITLGTYQFATVARLVRAEMEAALRQDYVKFARARGIGESSIVLGHALPNSLLPVVTVLGLQVGSLIAFAVVTETVFQWPGVGFLFMQAVEAADVPLMSAYLVIASLAFVTMNFLVDVFYFAMDPRLRVPPAGAAA